MEAWCSRGRLVLHSEDDRDRVRKDKGQWDAGTTTTPISRTNETEWGFVVIGTKTDQIEVLDKPRTIQSGMGGFQTGCLGAVHGDGVDGVDEMV
jgi:hypothetical protein